MTNSHSKEDNHIVRDLQSLIKHFGLWFINCGSVNWGGKLASITNCPYLFKVYVEIGASSIKLFKYIFNVAYDREGQIYHVDKQNDKGQTKKSFLDEVVKFFQTRPVLLQLQRQFMVNFLKLLSSQLLKIFIYGEEKISMGDQAMILLKSFAIDENLVDFNMKKSEKNKVKFDIFSLLQKKIRGRIKPDDFDYINKKQFIEYKKEKLAQQDPYKDGPSIISSKYSCLQMNNYKKYVYIKQLNKCKDTQNPSNKYYILKRVIELLEEMFQEDKKRNDKKTNESPMTQSSNQPLNTSPTVAILTQNNRNSQNTQANEQLQSIQSNSVSMSPPRSIQIDHPNHLSTIVNMSQKSIKNLLGQGCRKNDEEISNPSTLENQQQLNLFDVINFQ